MESKNQLKRYCIEIVVSSPDEESAEDWIKGQLEDVPNFGENYRIKEISEEIPSQFNEINLPYTLNPPKGFDESTQSTTANLTTTPASSYFPITFALPTYEITLEFYFKNGNKITHTRPYKVEDHSDILLEIGELQFQFLDLMAGNSKEASPVIRFLGLILDLTDCIGFSYKDSYPR